MISYELALKLKNAGFPFKTTDWAQNEKIEKAFFLDEPYGRGYIPPTLSELIEACGGYLEIKKGTDSWRSVTSFKFPDNAEMDWQSGQTPEESVANLWLELNK